MQLAWITAPVIGGLIGLITNSLAIRMLFRPHRAIYIGRFHVPFTPGLIPKEKERIAGAIGEVISKYLLDDATIQRAICDPAIKEKVSVHVHDLIMRMKQVTISLEVFLDQKGLSDSLNVAETGLRNSVSSYVTNAIVESNLVDELIENALLSVQREMNPLVARIAKNPLTSAKPQIIANAREILRERGPQMIGGYIDQKYAEICDYKICDLAALAEEHEKEAVDFLWEKYVYFIEKKSAALLKDLDLQRIVEERINGYDVAQLEKIILSISKKELHALVWLGGLLGMLMGFVNLLF
ncbi:MAG: DUF445 domain-containing protein [Lachnospiraceae bacterium]